MRIKLLVGSSVAALAVSVASAQSASNHSQITQSEDTNSAIVHNSEAINSSSTIIQTGPSNSATVLQAGDGHSSTIGQTGASNIAYHHQRGSRNLADTAQNGNGLSNQVAQGGEDNTVLVRQAGDTNASQVSQGSKLQFSTSGAVTYVSGYEAERNSATVVQTGSGLYSEVEQLGSSANTSPGQFPPASDNVAQVNQRNPVTTYGGRTLTSYVRQNSRGNKAVVFQIEGSAQAPNRSEIVQRNSAATTVANPITGNVADISQRGLGNQSYVLQDGLRNRSEVSMLGGGALGGSTAPQAGPPSASYQGNRSEIRQTGNDLYAAISSGGRGAKSNLSSINQNSGNSHQALVWQLGTQDQVTITQNYNGSQGSNGQLGGAGVQPPSPYSDGSIARSIADVSQRGVRDVVNVTQNGDNYAQITQGLGTESSTRVIQVDAGDFTSATAPTGATSLRAANRVMIAQYGGDAGMEMGDTIGATNPVGALYKNTIVVQQNALNGDTTLWQQVGSLGNEIAVNQGGGLSLRADLDYPVGPAAGGVNTANVSATITQGGRFNHSTVNQDGKNLTATVTQQGWGMVNNNPANGATGTFRNAVRVHQTGSHQYANVTQAPTVGASDANSPASGTRGQPFSHPGGRRAAEAIILQGNSGNSATVQQFGKGQFARIEQAGRGGVASIAQGVYATNATAIIRQTGTNNSYSVTQTVAGQYIYVTQSGEGNTVTNVVTSGPPNSAP